MELRNRTIQPPLRSSLPEAVENRHIGELFGLQCSRDIFGPQPYRRDPKLSGVIFGQQVVTFTPTPEGRHAACGTRLRLREVSLAPSLDYRRSWTSSHRSTPVHAARKHRTWSSGHVRFTLGGLSLEVVFPPSSLSVFWLLRLSPETSSALVLDETSRGWWRLDKAAFVAAGRGPQGSRRRHHRYISDSTGSWRCLRRARIGPGTQQCWADAAMRLVLLFSARSKRSLLVWKPVTMPGQTSVRTPMLSENGAPFPDGDRPENDIRKQNVREKKKFRARKRLIISFAVQKHSFSVSGLENLPNKYGLGVVLNDLFVFQPFLVLLAFTESRKKESFSTQTQ